MEHKLPVTYLEIVELLKKVKTERKNIVNCYCSIYGDGSGALVVKRKDTVQPKDFTFYETVFQGENDFIEKVFNSNYSYNKEEPNYSKFSVFFNKMVDFTAKFTATNGRAVKLKIYPDGSSELLDFKKDIKEFDNRYELRTIMNRR